MSPPQSIPPPPPRAPQRRRRWPRAVRAAPPTLGPLGGRPRGPRRRRWPSLCGRPSRPSASGPSALWGELCNVVYLQQNAMPRCCVSTLGPCERFSKNKQIAIRLQVESWFCGIPIINDTGTLRRLSMALGNILIRSHVDLHQIFLGKLGIQP